MVGGGGCLSVYLSVWGLCQCVCVGECGNSKKRDVCEWVELVAFLRSWRVGRFISAWGGAPWGVGVVLWTGVIYFSFQWAIYFFYFELSSGKHLDISTSTSLQGRYWGLCV